jgi:hypothetical protein
LTAPYAVVSWNSVHVSFTGRGASLVNPTQNHRFTIVGRFPYPIDPAEVVDLQRVGKANLLIAQLQGAASFAGIGMFPLVTQIDSARLGSPDEKVYEVTLVFEVQTLASHH